MLLRDRPYWTRPSRCSQGRGYDVLLPFGENTRYDLVIDNGMTLSQVQCKPGGCEQAPFGSQRAARPNPKLLRRDYLGQIDYFGAYCQETARVYLVPIADAPLTREVALRVDPSRNGQARRIRFASAYEIANLQLAS